MFHTTTLWSHNKIYIMPNIIEQTLKSMQCRKCSAAPYASEVRCSDRILILKATVDASLASVQLQGFFKLWFFHSFRRWRQVGFELKSTIGMSGRDWLGQEDIWLISPKMDRWAWRVKTTWLNGDVHQTFGYICMIVKHNEFWIILLFNYYGELANCTKVALQILFQSV